jgi:hypothetical protein
MFQLDKYTIKARLYPSFIVLVPAFIVSIYYITDIEKYYHYFTAIAAIGLFTFLLSQLGRDKGKLNEPSLHIYFGGKPTTQILRHSNNHIDPITKERYHKLLSQKIADIQIPTAAQENNNINHSDQVYDSCAKFLISKTRDTNKFNLLFKENISYGFRRNLWGMKSWALILIVICFIFHFYFASNYFVDFNTFSKKDIGLFVFLLATTFFWFFRVTKEWIKLVAFAYAERLYETLNDLP